MSLTWKDALTTVLALATMSLYYAMSKGIHIPLIGGYRTAIVALTIFGIAMCAFGSQTTNTTNTTIFVSIATVLGIASIVFIIYGLITGTHFAFALLTGTILLLWVIATIDHIISR